MKFTQGTWTEANGTSLQGYVQTALVCRATLKPTITNWWKCLASQKVVETRPQSSGF